MSEAREAGYLNSIQVGLPTEHPAGGIAEKPWQSGIRKAEVRGPIWLGRENLRGDGQHNRKVHGGPDRALLSYAAAHYVDWAAELGEQLPVGFAPGAFGENFTVSGLDEGTVCLGDVYVIGGAEIEVSQPRLPCANLARRWQLPELPRWVEESGRGGWYARVLREGEVQAGQLILRKARPHPDWTIRRLTAIYLERSQHAGEATREAWSWLAGCAALSELWREQFRKKLGRRDTSRP
ncbi:MAG: MOSC domain-containing protein [Anaerolineaceae bacterium]|nr:MOSC domain-containing protein [Anaerolineaceae bacterium]